MEVVADRIERVVNVVGDPHRVLAGTDCRFATAAGLGEVAEEVVWEKLRALRAGADLVLRPSLCALPWRRCGLARKFWFRGGGRVVGRWTPGSCSTTE